MYLFSLVDFGASEGVGYFMVFQVSPRALANKYLPHWTEWSYCIFNPAVSTCSYLYIYLPITFLYLCLVYIPFVVWPTYFWRSNISCFFLTYAQCRNNKRVSESKICPFLPCLDFRSFSSIYMSLSNCEQQAFSNFLWESKWMASSSSLLPALAPVLKNLL